MDATREAILLRFSQYCQGHGLRAARATGRHRLTELGARGWREYRHVVLPAALPSFVGGLKQGWAFAWRSLMAGELIVIIADRPSIGSRLQFYRDASDYPSMMAVMLIILMIGILADTLLFGALERAVRRRHGLTG